MDFSLALFAKNLDLILLKMLLGHETDACNQFSNSSSLAFWPKL